MKRLEGLLGEGEDLAVFLNFSYFSKYLINKMAPLRLKTVDSLAGTVRPRQRF